MPRRKAKKRKLNNEKVNNPSVDFNEPQPTEHPPRLERFLFHDSDIEFVSLLSAENPGSHSHVFDVFKFYDVAEHEQDLGDKVKQDTIIAHLDPFFAECRAYGYIEQKRGNGNVAVPCHGFMTIPATEEDYFRRKFDVTDWDRPPEEYDLPVSERQSFRAIVKDLIKDKASFRTKDLNRMVKDLRALRKMPVFVRDIREDNYRGGKLLDFSVAWTPPHVMLDTRIRDVEQIAEDILEELILFDEMVVQSNVSNPKWLRAAAHPDFIRDTARTGNITELSKLRPRLQRD
ncbi:MAG: hypothetical protein MMC33_009472 [Icmadophila ericetorum]|nr:hypothetical protein [Icmadophila ericetorum]